MDLTPKQQTSEAIRQADNILILTGQHPSIDQVAAMISLAAVLRKYGKKVTAIISDSLPPQVSFLPTNTLDRNLAGMRDFILRVNMNRAEVDKLRYEVENGKLNIYITPFQGGFAPSDVTFDYGAYKYDVAIVLGVPTRARIDRIYEQNQNLFAELPILNIDFHRSNENYGAVNLIEPTASSLSEILVALAESLQNGIIDETIATSLLTGIMASTDRFTATHTTSKSLTVGAQLMAAGAHQQDVVRGLFRDNRESGRGDQPRSGGGSDRGGSGGGQRQETSRPDASRTEAPRTETHRSEEPRHDEPRHEVVEQTVPETVHTEAPQAVRANDLGEIGEGEIIAPGHIELMPQVEADDIPMYDVMPVLEHSPEPEQA